MINVTNKFELITCTFENLSILRKKCQSIFAEISFQFLQLTNLTKLTHQIHGTIVYFRVYVYMDCKNALVS